MPRSPAIEAVDDYTVQVTLENPSQSFLTRMADRSGIVVPENFFEDNDAGTTVIGTGSLHVRGVPDRPGPHPAPLRRLLG
jgi:ABC-type transport system substrate-binding protein